MKFNRFLILIGASLALFAGCNPNGKYPSGYQFEQILSTLEVNEQGAGKSSFIAGDEISVFNANSGNKLFVFSSASGTTYTFNLESGSSSDNSVSGNFALYPYSEDNSISQNGTFSYYFGREHKAVTNQPGPLVGYTADGKNKLNFKNAFGYISVKLIGHSTITAIKIKGNKNEIISGNVKIDASAFDTLKVSVDAAGGYNDLIMYYEDGVSIADAGATFYIPVPPCKFSDGISLEFYDNTGRYMSKSSSSSFTLEANGVKQIEAVTYSPNNGNECPVIDQTVPGVYNLAGVSLYQYSDDADQIVSSVKSDKFSFRLLNTVYDKFISIDNMPDDMAIGDSFTVDITRYAVDETIPSGEQQMIVVKKKDNIYWLSSIKTINYFIIEK